ncbi:MAG: hypothetical protein J3R72DRAFT_437829 [Linnemannia gamsii]|nr:MAG: hypothetical protein J3R72DRAFT_437829 [Linnemannia gamsii]
MWSVGVTALSLKDAIINNIEGLSDANLQLMKQRAVDIDKIELSEGSTEKYFRKWGYFDSDDEEEGGKAAMKKKGEETKKKERVEEKKEKAEEKKVEKEEKEGQKVKGTMKEPGGDTSDSGKVRALMKRVGDIKRAEAIQRAVNDLQARAITRSHQSSELEPLSEW